MAKKSSKKKVTTKSKSTNQQSPPVVATWVPTMEMKRLATQVLWEPHKHKAFRKRATVAGQFRDELRNAPQYQQLQTEGELAFCEGWLHLARLEFGDDPDVLDHHIVNRLKAAIYEDGLGPYSG